MLHRRTVPVNPLDAPKVVATGVRGRITWAYYTAADVGGYTVERLGAGEYYLRAHLVNADDYKLAQAPLTFIVTTARGEWEWPVRTVLGYRDHAFTAKLGAPVAVIRRSA